MMEENKASLVDHVASILPGLGSLIPAVMTFQNTMGNLHFEWWQAGVISAVLEGLGFATITTTLDVFEQDQADATDGKVRLTWRFWVSVSGTGVYLVVVVLINAVLDSGSVERKLTLGLLALTALVGGVMVALRNQLSKQRAVKNAAVIEQKQGEKTAQEQAWKVEEERLENEHKEKLAVIAAENSQKLAEIEAEGRRKLAEIRADGRRKAAEPVPDASGSVQKVSGEAPGTPRKWADVPQDDYAWIVDAPVGEIVEKYKLGGKDPARLARTWKVYARERIEKAGGANV